MSSTVALFQIIGMSITDVVCHSIFWNSIYYTQHSSLSVACISSKSLFSWNLSALAITNLCWTNFGGIWLVSHLWNVWPLKLNSIFLVCSPMQVFQLKIFTSDETGQWIGLLILFPKTSYVCILWSPTDHLPATTSQEMLMHNSRMKYSSLIEALKSALDHNHVKLY